VAGQTLIRGGQVVDGTGAAPFAGDVLVQDGKIAAVGAVEASDAAVIDASGCLVTPGFVDVHTHYDGQAIWSSHMAPSSHNGVTSVVMGNCGVGFAPCRPNDHDLLISAMEGVEDIPGAVMAEGLTWNWETYPQFLDALESRPRDIDVASLLPHSCLRVYAMGQRGADREPATAADMHKMAGIAAEAAEAGAMGFATSSVDIHRRGDGVHIPSYEAAEAELTAVARSFGRGRDGVFQMVPSFGQTEAEIHARVDTLARISANAEVTVTFTLATLVAPSMRMVMDAVTAANEREGVVLRPQVLPKPIGFLVGHDVSANPFVLCPSYKAIAHLPLAERVAELRKPEVRARILAEEPDDALLPLVRFARNFGQTFLLTDGPPCEPSPEESIEALAERRGVSAAEYAYDLLLEDEGRALLTVALGSIGGGTRDDVFEIIRRPDVVVALGDGGAHYGMICDACYPSLLLSYWARDRARGTLSVAEAVRALTSTPATTFGFHDRGRLAEGFKADINVIDFNRVGVAPLQVLNDLPAGGKRLHQSGRGYRATLVAGTQITRDDAPTGALPGRLFRRGSLAA
jgi:N-acyl-D-aspartate/D-glutamate deacylase